MNRLLWELQVAWHTRQDHVLCAAVSFITLVSLGVWLLRYWLSRQPKGFRLDQRIDSPEDLKNL